MELHKSNLVASDSKRGGTDLNEIKYGVNKTRSGVVQETEKTRKPD
jgi:hypothetical protein